MERTTQHAAKSCAFFFFCLDANVSEILNEVFLFLEQNLEVVVSCRERLTFSIVLLPYYTARLKLAKLQA